MDIAAGIIKLLFGSKADKDRKEVQPYIDRIKAVYPTIEKLTNDELRAHSAGLMRQIADHIADDEARIVEMKARLEQPATSLDERRRSRRRSTPRPSASTRRSRRSSTASCPRLSPS